jgi:hypothetical protein
MPIRSKDKKGKWTHWENAVYDPSQREFLDKALVETFIALKKPASWTNSFEIDRIDFCEFGNSIPFRVKIIEKATGKPEFFYIKQADASRVYGLELEYLLTGNPINFLYFQNTLVEEHIAGIPGDQFLSNSTPLTEDQKKAVAQAFVEFNESCFVRLLGDMRSYNFVVSTSKVGHPYRLRAIDFDQQSYEGRKWLYFPRYYKENKPYAELVEQYLSPDEIAQTRSEANTDMAARITACRRRMMQLVNSMVKDEISETYKIRMLGAELNQHFGITRFSRCKTMGAIVKQQLKQVLQQHLETAKLSN